jgi:DNA primase
LFRKGANLYGLFQAKESIREGDRVLVVEGYLDVLALFQFGICYGVATLGTALTPDHVRILGRYTKNIIALFDGDDAGKKAAARSFDVFIEGGMLGRTAFLPEKEDPDTFVRSRGKEALEAIVEESVPLADYTFTWLEWQHGKSLEGKSRIAQEVSRLLAKVRNPFEADLLARRAADSLGITEELLRRSSRAPEAQGARVAQVAPSNPSQGGNREGVAERLLVGLMLHVPRLIPYVGQEEDVQGMVGPKWKEVVQRILSVWKEREKIDIAHLTHGFTVDQASEIAGVMLEVEDVPEEECEKMAEDCLSYLRRRHLRDLQRDLLRAIRAAEEKKDEKAIRERMLEWQDVVRKERQLERQKLAPKTEIR